MEDSAAFAPWMYNFWCQQCERVLSKSQKKKHQHKDLQKIDKHNWTNHITKEPCRTCHTVAKQKCSDCDCVYRCENCETLMIQHECEYLQRETKIFADFLMAQLRNN